MTLSVYQNSEWMGEIGKSNPDKLVDKSFSRLVMSLSFSVNEMVQIWSVIVWTNSDYNSLSLTTHHIVWRGDRRHSGWGQANWAVAARSCWQNCNPNSTELLSNITAAKQSRSLIIINNFVSSQKKGWGRHVLFKIRHPNLFKSKAQPYILEINLYFDLALLFS